MRFSAVRVEGAVIMGLRVIVGRAVRGVDRGLRRDELMAKGMKR